MTDTATKIELLMNGLIAPVQPAWIDEAIALLPQAKTEIERLRAIIKTIREPTDEMLRAGNVRTFPDSYYAMVGMATDGYQQLLRTTVSEQTLIGKIAHQQDKP